MALSLELGRKFLGKPITDSYGRSLGRVVGLAADVKNEVGLIEIELGNGEFFSCPSYQVSFKGDSATYIYQWRIDADHVEKELDLALRRLRALEELFRVGEIPKDIYEEFRKQHENAVTQLKDRRQTVVTGLKDKVGRLNLQIKELQTFLASLKMQHTTGDIDDGTYKDASGSIEAGLNRAFSEKDDLEAVIEGLMKLDIKLMTPPQLTPHIEVKPATPTPAQLATPEVKKETPIIVRFEEK